MDNVVCLGGEHALNIVVDVAEDYTVPLAASWLLCCQWFDLEALQDRNWELDRRSVRLVEDGAGEITSVRQKWDEQGDRRRRWKA